MSSNVVIQKFAESVNNKVKFNYSGNPDGLTASIDFTNTTNHIAIHLCGHNHKDESSLLNNVLSVSTMCDALYNDDPKYTEDRIRGTVNEQCIDIISLDTTNHLIKLCRIGAGNGDRSFEY